MATRHPEEPRFCAASPKDRRVYSSPILRGSPPCGERLRMTVVGVASTSRAHRLDIVAVRVDQERGIIGRAVVGAQARAAIVAAAGFQALGMEAFDRGMVGRAECDMGAGSVAL